MILFDTNIHVRLGNPKSDPQGVAIAAASSLVQAGWTPCVTPQVLYEYWVVATRPPSANGYGATVAEADREISAILRRCLLLDDREGITARWRRRVKTNRVMGKSAHDAHLVAAMEDHGVPAILTFNFVDFQRYGHVTTVNPADVATFLTQHPRP